MSPIRHSSPAMHQCRYNPFGVAHCEFVNIINRSVSYNDDRLAIGVNVDPCNRCREELKQYTPIRCHSAPIRRKARLSQGFENNFRSFFRGDFVK
jgi:hypothetical protein